MFIVRNIGINCSFVDVTPFELFQTDKKVLVINDPKEINVILEFFEEKSDVIGNFVN